MDKSEQIYELIEIIGKNEKEEEEKREPYVKALVEGLKIPEEKALAFVADANKISYQPNEFALIVEYYCDVFNGFDNLNQKSDWQ